jgi:hypothetical protein
LREKHSQQFSLLATSAGKRWSPICRLRLLRWSSPPRAAPPHRLTTRVRADDMIMVSIMMMIIMMIRMINISISRLLLLIILFLLLPLLVIIIIIIIITGV